MSATARRLLAKLASRRQVAVPRLGPLAGPGYKANITAATNATFPASYTNFWVAMARPLKITDNIVQIFNLMLERPTKAWYGLELAAAAGIGSATIYQALTRMERAELLRATWEAESASHLGRPQRRLYELTAEGAEVGREAIRNYRPRVSIAPAHARWLPGAQLPEGAA